MRGKTESTDHGERILRRRVGRAISRFNLIAANDRIAIGLSGGKDSLTLVYTLAKLRQYAPVPFDLQAITLGMNDGLDVTGLKAFCQALEVPFHCSQTSISEIVFEQRQEKNPCSLCANLRRGALNNLAREFNCNKVALGHHQDDVIETLLLGMIFEGRLHTFSPRTYLSRKDLTVIRPLVFVPEAVIIDLAAARQFPVTANCCPANGHTKRQEMKELIGTLEGRYPNIRSKLLSSVQNIDIEAIWQN